MRGFGYLLYLAIPGVFVFAWYLVLLSRRAERRQWLVEILAAGALALNAPAAMWIGLGVPDPSGWLLWALVWAQSAASIVYTYLRLAPASEPVGAGARSKSVVDSDPWSISLRAHALSAASPSARRR